MNIEEAKELKQQLEKTIALLLAEFSQKAGVKVKSIRLDNYIATYDKSGKEIFNYLIDIEARL